MDVHRLPRITGSEISCIPRMSDIKLEASNLTTHIVRYQTSRG